ncbi:MAG: DUF58 domain-containing protein [bacterium]
MSSSHYLDPEALGRLRNLSLAARLVVEGYFSGLHKSPRHGFSVEFAEHREYTPGVDPRHIDWRVFGRQDKLYVKQYEEETSLRAWLVVDKSASMGYRHLGAMTKLEYACYLAASLAYLMRTQQDAVGLITCDTVVAANLPPRQGPMHFAALIEQLENARPGGETSLAKVLDEIAEQIPRRSLVIVLSDLFDDAGRVVQALKHFRHRKHEVIVFHILDPAERSFPFEDISAIEDMESGRVVHSDPQAFRRAYLNSMKSFLEVLRNGCGEAAIDYVAAETNTPFAGFLTSYLARRSQFNKATG